MKTWNLSTIINENLYFEHCSMKELFEQFGIFITPIAALVTIILATVPFIRNLSVNKNRLKREKIKSIISPISGAKNIITTLLETDYYIPVMAQEEEPNDSDSYFSSQPSIVDILIDEWKQMDGEKKRYIVWGGSGTGKTTFLAALVYKYIKSFKLGKEPYQIKVFGLNDLDNELFTEIEKVDEQENTILILDALDENFDANKDIISFMDRINKTTRRFAIVIITSRQVFSRGEEILNEIPILGFDLLKWKYYYILPFNDTDVHRYLNKKFPNIVDYGKAIKIVEKSSTLMSRAMVLSFIDYLIDLNPVFLTRAQLYKHIVDKWLYRELAAVQGEKNKLKYKNNYYHFSAIIAKEMYDNWLKNSKLLISQDKLDNLVNEYSYLFPENYFPYKVRSLIERNNDDEYRFAHKSFWEFFLAIYSIEHPGYPFALKESLGATQEFANDIARLYVEGIKYEEIDYYNPMGDDIVLNINSMLDTAIQKFEQADDKEKSNIYNRLQCALYRKFCYDIDYKYANYQLEQSDKRFNVVLNNLQSWIDELIFKNVISDNTEDLTVLSKAAKQLSCEFPPNILTYSRTKIVVYQSSISDILKQMSCYQIWYASSFFADESALIQSLVAVLGKIEYNMLNNSRHLLVSTIGIIREIEEDEIPSFIMALQKGLNNSLKKSGVIILIDIISYGTHIPFALSKCLTFNNQNEVKKFMNKMKNFM